MPYDKGLLCTKQKRHLSSEYPDHKNTTSVELPRRPRHTPVAYKGPAVLQLRSVVLLQIPGAPAQGDHRIILQLDQECDRLVVVELQADAIDFVA